MTRLASLASLASLAVLASACASVPMAPPEADRLAKEFRTTPGKTNVYVFRDESLGGAVKMNVSLDGRMLGPTASKTFLLTSVAPGKHAIVGHAENDAKLEFVAVPGKNVFVWQEVKMGFLSARNNLQFVDEQSARPRVNVCSLAAEYDAAPPPAPTSAPAKEPAAVPGA